LVLIYGGQPENGENLDEDLMYHVGIKEGNKKWTDKDYYTKVRRGLNSSKDVEASPLATEDDNKTRIFYKKKQDDAKKGNRVVIKDKEEIARILKNLKEAL
jgi:hypothetical protein